VTTWAQALDAFEDRLALQRAELDRGLLQSVPPFVAPLGMGPLEGEHLDRAIRLLDDAHDLEAELEGAIAHTREDLSVVGTLLASTGPAARASFVDTAL
jgi:hypothetical protein